MKYPFVVRDHYGDLRNYALEKDALSGKREETVLYVAVKELQRIETPSGPLPFEVGKVYKDGFGHNSRVLAIDGSPNEPIITMLDGRVNFYTKSGKWVPRSHHLDPSENYGSKYDLIPDQSPATSTLEWVALPSVKGET